MTQRKRDVARTSENGIWFDVISFFQFFISCFRNSWLNGPAYDRKPVARRTSPTSRLICASKPLLAAVHLIFSPDRPSINAVAMFILRRHAFASSTSACISNSSLPSFAVSCRFTKRRIFSDCDSLVCASSGNLCGLLKRDVLSLTSQTLYMTSDQLCQNAADR